MARIIIIKISVITSKRRKEIYSNDGNLEKCKIHSISLIIQISIEYLQHAKYASDFFRQR